MGYMTPKQKFWDMVFRSMACSALIQESGLWSKDAVERRDEPSGA